MVAESSGQPRPCVIRDLRRNSWSASPTVRPVGRPVIAGGFSLGVKGAGLSVYSEQHLDDIALTLNTRLQKSLGWHT